MRVISTCGLTSMDENKSLAGTKYSTFMQNVLALDSKLPVKEATAQKLNVCVRLFVVFVCLSVLHVDV
jgi:hypothetical protein